MATKLTLLSLVVATKLTGQHGQARQVTPRESDFRIQWQLRRVPQSSTHLEQNHNPTGKEKGFKLKEYSRVKGHESFSESDSKTGITVAVHDQTFALALRPFVGVAWG